VYEGELRDRLEREVQGPNAQGHLGLSPAAYDLLRIGGWALVLAGALPVAAALPRRRGARRQRAPAQERGTAIRREAQPAARWPPPIDTGHRAGSPWSD